MPDRPALSAGIRGRLTLVAALLALASGLCSLAGCAQPGTQVPVDQAAKLAVGTSDISNACGYLEELTAFGGGQASGVASIESMADTGAGKLAAVYARDQTDIYQGESIGAVLGDSISLLHDCGLRGAQKLLVGALRAHR